ncbi:MAG TPA: ROK family transcriptional regulator, partial [bacterium]|nr:ROK family transcriptional regulator [bacterium]
NLMNPELIILGGPTTRLGPRLLDAVRQTLERRTLALPLAGVKIVAPALRSDSAAMGAAVLALDSAWMAEEQT